MTITVKQVDLKPCPFCGGAPRRSLAQPKNGPINYAVGCSECPIATDWLETEDQAITAWNTRPPITNEQIEAAARAIMKRAGETANADESEEWFAEQFARAALSTLEVR